MDYEKIEKLVVMAKENNINSNDAKNQLLEAFKPFIFNLCKTNYVQNYSYEDLLQECYFSVLKAINMYNPDNKSFAKYCTVSIRNCIKMLIRQNARYNSNVDISIANIVNYDCEIALDRMCNEELKNNIDSALDRLKVNEKAVILHYFFEKQPMNRFFTRTGFKYKKAAIKKLRIYLKEEKPQC